MNPSTTWRAINSTPPNCDNVWGSNRSGREARTTYEGERKGGWAALRMPRPQLLGGATTP